MILTSFSLTLSSHSELSMSPTNLDVMVDNFMVYITFKYYGWGFYIGTSVAWGQNNFLATRAIFSKNLQKVVHFTKDEYLLTGAIL